MNKVISKFNLISRVAKRGAKSLLKNKGNIKIHGNSPLKLSKIVILHVKRYGFKSQAKPSKNR